MGKGNNAWFNMEEENMSLIIKYEEIFRIQTEKPLGDLLEYRTDCFIDEAFMSESRWDEEDIKSYILSILLNMTLTPFIVANAEKCLLNTTDESSKRYYTDVIENKKKKLITADSINRQLAIWKTFVENEVDLPVGEFTINNIKFTIEPNTRFEDLSGGTQNLILGRTIPHQEITKATREQLSYIFRAVNSGVNQNKQEYRQSNFVPNAQPIRDVAKKHKDLFVNAKLVEKKNINRRFVDELMLDYSAFAYEGFGSSNINPTKRDSFYEPELGSVLVAPVKVVDGVVSKITITPPTGAATYDLRSVSMNIYMRIILGKSNYGIADEDKFNIWVYEKHLEFLNNKKLQFTMPNGVSYPYASTGRRQTPYARWNLNLFLEALSKEDELVFDKDPKRLFSMAQTYEMWVRQDGKSAVETLQPNGKMGYSIIPIQELFNKKKWQSDHHPERHADSGPTTIENGRVIEASINSATKDIKGPITTTRFRLSDTEEGNRAII